MFPINLIIKEMVAEPDEVIKKGSDLLVKKTGKSKDHFAREAILEHLEELEDIYLATSRVKEPCETYSAEDVKLELGL